MYLKNMTFRNYGPLNNIDINASFNEDGSPRPIVFMGKNGSGKTLILSQILQSLLNGKSEEYNNIPEKEKHQLYKLMSISYINNRKIDCCSAITFDNDYSYYEIMSKDPQYTIDNNVYEKYTSNLNNNNQFKKDGMIENNSGRLKYDDGVYLYFPVDRYYVPGWKNKEIKTELRIQDKYIGKSLRNIVCTSIQSDLESYILETIIDREIYDKKIYIKDNDGNFVADKYGEPRLIYRGKNGLILEFINNILSEFKDDIYFNKRLYVGRKNNRKIGIMGVTQDGKEEEIIDSLSKLSTGEYSLLSMFTAILIDFDNVNYKDNFNFQDIKGTVIIDEAELNLHIDLQINVLPKLIKKFKGIQFIITTQSPFLIYGLKNILENNYDIYDMPDGIKIDNSLDLSEVKAAYDTMINSNEELMKIVNESVTNVKNSNDDLFVITEGKTDPIYMTKAIEKLKLYQDKKINIIGLKSEAAGKYQEEGFTGLNKLAEALTVVNPQTPVIFVYDRDVISNELLNNNYIKYDNNIYKMAIPIPSHRKECKDLCIEHYFTDDEIKRTDINGHRLYIGNEFNSNGISFKGKLMCKSLEKCGKNSIKIIDGSGKTKVFNQNDEDTKNLALSKIKFAENIKNDVSNFDNFDFSEFKKIFDVFDEIIIDAKNKKAGD